MSDNKALLERGWSDAQIIRYLVEEIGLTEQYARLHLAAMRGQLKSDRLDMAEDAPTPEE